MRKARGADEGGAKTSSEEIKSGCGWRVSRFEKQEEQMRDSSERDAKS